jgi:hypothetical protein
VDHAEAARLTEYLFNAALAGRATFRHWQRWADRMIEAGELDLWILDVRLARTLDELRNSLQPALPNPPDTAAVIGYLWIRHLQGAWKASDILYRATQEMSGSSVELALQQLRWDLELADEESQVERGLAELVKSHRLAELAREEWRSLFPGDDL